MTIDPTNHSRFYAIGEYADEWAVIPGFTTTPRAIWHTYISQITFVPEPGSLVLVMVAIAAGVAGAGRRAAPRLITGLRH